MYLLPAYLRLSILWLWKGRLRTSEFNSDSSKAMYVLCFSVAGKLMKIYRQISVTKCELVICLQVLWINLVHLLHQFLLVIFSFLMKRIMAGFLSLCFLSTRTLDSVTQK
eukprot:c24841_g1_i1 orf=64-393(-)